MIAGLDSIRFLCAVWVTISHFGAPPLMNGLDKSTLFGWLIRGFYGNLFSGPAAVIVFFVISGLCIHYPFAASSRINSLKEYFARRYIRIGFPMAVAIVLADRLNVNMSVFNIGVLWSLVAELVYYTIYPALLRLRRSGISWSMMIGVAFAAALVIPAVFPSGRNYPSPGDYPAFGFELNWLLGLPCWLLGCRLAETLRNTSVPTNAIAFGLGPSPLTREEGGARWLSSCTPPRLAPLRKEERNFAMEICDRPAVPAVGRLEIWWWRIAVWGASSVCSVLRFHTPIGYPWTLNVFAFLVALWLAREAAYCASVKPPDATERAGRWSYALYLTHGLAGALVAQLPLLQVGELVHWTAKMTCALMVAFAFGFIVEAPAHRLARTVGAWARGHVEGSAGKRTSA